MTTRLTSTQAHALVAALPTAVAVFDDAGRFSFCNAAFMTRASRAGIPVHGLSGQFGCLPGVEDANGTVEVAGGELPYARIAVPGLGWLCTLADEAASGIRADIDDLTGLPGRKALVDAINHGFDVGPRDRNLAFAMIDLDRFKSVNDTLGHDIGDKLLVKVSQRLRSAVRDGDLLARLGGDEFGLLQIGAEQPACVEATAARIVEIVGRPYVIDGQMMEIGASVGIAIAPQDADDAAKLMKRADVALYRVKNEGRNAYRFFRSGMDTELRARRELEEEMRRALAYREFELHYQPQKDLPSGAVTGFEALIRWNNAERGLVPPDAFIPLAEETGFIVSLGEWIVRQACADCATWPAGMNVAVNISTRQLMDENLVAVVENALAVNGLEPARLEVEVTESVLMADTERCTQTLRQLRELGATISLDDFGTGYSSISYLRSFPFDKLKIDQSFVRSADVRSNELVKAIVDMSRHFNMLAIAEGVETEEQARAMEAFGCQAVQGYWLSRALPGPEALEMAVREAESRRTGAPPSGLNGEAELGVTAAALPTRATVEENLVRLVYTSRNAVDALEQDLEAAVLKILEKSQRRNARVGVTGALLFTAGHFAQVLEGDAAAVEATFERIQRDDRHAAVQLIEYARVGERRFADWSMAYAGGRADVHPGLPHPDAWSAEGAEGLIATLSNLLQYEERHDVEPHGAERHGVEPHGAERHGAEPHGAEPHLTAA